MTAYIQHEFEEGVKAYLPPYPTAGFENSLFILKVTKSVMAMVMTMMMMMMMIAMTKTQ